MPGRQGAGVAGAGRVNRVERERLVCSAAARRRFAAENEGNADRFAAAGIDRIAGHYRAAARQHETSAKRLEADICA